MLNKKLSAAILVGALAWSGASMAACWLPAQNGNVPGGAMVAGHEASGASLYVCHARTNGGVQPGKVRPGIGGCNIPFGGYVITKHFYKVLVTNNRVCRRHGRGW